MLTYIETSCKRNQYYLYIGKDILKIILIYSIIKTYFFVMNTFSNTTERKQSNKNIKRGNNLVPV